jgi:hypothetical protein
MQKWEYAVLVINPNREGMSLTLPGKETEKAPDDLPMVLNDLGDIGFELITSIVTTTNGTTTAEQMVFKRPILVETEPAISLGGHSS